MPARSGPACWHKRAHRRPGSGLSAAPAASPTRRTGGEIIADRRNLDTVLNARNESEFEQVFVTVEQQRIGAMVVTSDAMFSNESATLGRVSARHTVPTMGCL
jgi:hypothetical protein